MLRFICYPKCTTCQRAKKWLDDNTSGLLYKSLDLKNKLPEMSEDEMLKLLATDGMLVKRPLLIGDDFVFVGFKETEWESIK